MHNVTNEYSDCTTIKHCKMAICSCHHTIITLYFLSMAWLQYGPHLYSTIFCMAVAVYGTVVSPSHEYLTLC